MADPARSHPATPPLASAARDAAIARLSAAFADDAMELDEFERRAAAVFRATSTSELTALLADLPAATPASAASGAATTTPLALAPRPLLARVHALLGSVDRRGKLEVPARLDIRALFSDVQIDLSAAHFVEPVTTISIITLASSVSLRLPAGAVIDNRGSGTLASFACRSGAPRIDGRTEAPRVHVVVTGRALLGNVEIETASRAWVLAARPYD